MAVLNVLVDRGPADVRDVLADGSAYGGPGSAADTPARFGLSLTDHHVPAGVCEYIGRAA